MTIALDVITIGNNLDNTVSSQEIQCSSTAKMKIFAGNSSANVNLMISSQFLTKPLGLETDFYVTIQFPSKLYFCTSKITTFPKSNLLQYKEVKYIEIGDSTSNEK